MLRTARSLPSLRLLYQQESVAIKPQQTLFTSAYSHVTGDLAQPSVGVVRHVHQTSKKEVFLLDSTSNKTKYTTMNLNGLKMECRKRGLKVSGRKLDLIQRLISQDQVGVDNTRAMSQLSHTSKNHTMQPPSNKSFAKVGSEPLTLDNEVKKEPENFGISAKGRVMEKIAKDREAVVARQKEKVEMAKREKKQKEDRSQKSKVNVELKAKKTEVKARQNEELKEKKQAQLKAKRDLEVQVQAQMQAQMRAQLQKAEAEKLHLSVKNAVQEAKHHEVVSRTLKKAHTQSKSDTIKLARDQMQARAREEREESKRQEDSKREENANQEHRHHKEITSRDIKFFAAFGLSTLGWWSLKEKPV
jgi:hypothetical protein